MKQNIFNEAELILLKEHEFYLERATAGQFCSILKSLRFKRPEDATILYICKKKLYSEIYVIRIVEHIYAVRLKDGTDFYLIHCTDLSEFTQKLRDLLFFLKPQIFADFLGHLEFRDAPPIQSYTWNFSDSLDSLVPNIPSDLTTSINHAKTF